MDRSIPYSALPGCIRVKVSTAQKTGAEHLRQKKRCEDVIYIRQQPDFLFYGLADGQSETLCGAEGGRACLETVADFIRETGIGSILHTPFPDELPCLFVRQIRRRILSIANSRKIDYNEYASTLLALAVDPVSGDYILLHMGDGYAVGIRHDDTVCLLSPPENGISTHHTWLTTSHNAVSHFRVAFGSVRKQKRLLMMTDGATCFCRGKNILRQAKPLLQTGTREEITGYLNQSEAGDDASCIVLDLAAELPDSNSHLTAFTDT